MNASKAAMIGAGIFTVFCAYMDFDWFFNNYKARPLVNTFGRHRIRIFYIIIGIVVFFIGLFFNLT